MLFSLAKAFSYLLDVSVSELCEMVMFRIWPEDLEARMVAVAVLPMSGWMPIMIYSVCPRDSLTMYIAVSSWKRIFLNSVLVFLGLSGGFLDN